MLNLLGKRIIRWLDEANNIKETIGFITINNDIIIVKKSLDNTQKDELIIFKERIITIECVDNE